LRLAERQLLGLLFQEPPRSRNCSTPSLISHRDERIK
jgi:hypothetical protein